MNSIHAAAPELAPLLVDRLHAALLVVDERGRIVFANAKATEKEISSPLKVASNLTFESAGRNASWTKTATKFPSAAPKSTSEG